MFCQKCGGKLTGSENVCPFCGNSVNNNSQNNGNEPQIAPVDSNMNQMGDNMNNMNNDMNNNMNNNNMNNDMNNNMNNNNMNNGMNNNMNNNMNNGMNNNMNQNAPKKSNLTIILVVVLGLIIVIAAVVILAVVVFKKNPSGPGTEPTVVDPGSNPGGEPGGVSTADNVVTYNGFKFEVPAGYEAEQADSDLLVYNDSFAFRFASDFTNTYEQYVEAAKQQYPDQADQVEATVSGRKFVLLVGEKEGTKMAIFITKANDTSSFVGYAVRADNQIPNQSDLSVLATMFNSMSTSSSFAPGDSEDYGKDGLKFPEFNRDKVKFAE